MNVRSLGQVADIERDGVDPSALLEGTPYLGMENVTSDGELVDVRTVAAGELDSAKFAFGPEHILFGKLRPYLKKIAQPGFAGICSTELVPIRPKSGIATRYLYHFLRWQKTVDWATSLCAGANLPRLNPSMLATLPIPVPELAVQQAVATTLDHLDAIRRKQRQALALIDDLMRATFLEMFGDPVANSHKLPVVPLCELCNPKQWTTISGDQILAAGPYPVFGANGVIGYYDHFNHADETVLITCRGATCGTINVCTPKSYVTGNAMALDDPDPGRIEPAYLEWLLRLRGAQDAVTGTAQPQITRQSLAKISIPLPNLARQKHFAASVRRVLAVRQAIDQAAAETNALFTSTQAQAFGDAA